VSSKKFDLIFHFFQNFITFKKIESDMERIRKLVFDRAVELDRNNLKTDLEIEEGKKFKELFYLKLNRRNEKKIFPLNRRTKTKKNTRFEC